MRYLFKLLTPLLILLLVTLSLMLLKEREIFDTRGLVHIDPMPKTWELIEKNKYAEASDYLSYFMQFDYVKENQERLSYSMHYSRRETVMNINKRSLFREL
jgi:hypothetical protein